MARPTRRQIAWGLALLGLLIGAAFLLRGLVPGRPYDPSYDTRVAAPAYAAGGPKVLYDEAHRNLHASTGGYKPFVDLLRNDGYQVEVLREPFTLERLAGAAVLMIVCAVGANPANDAPAFSEAEIETVERWVREGGSLLLVADHWPFGPAAQALAARLGVDMSGGMVQEPEHFEAGLGDTHVVFTRENGLLREHPVTEGASPDERVTRVLTFTGTSLRAEPPAVAFLELGRAALDYPPTPPSIEQDGRDVRVSMNYGEPGPAAGRAQGIALELGAGRVVVLGESGMLRAYHDQNDTPIGMNYPGYDNRKLGLNLLHWLSRRI